MTDSLNKLRPDNPTVFVVDDDPAVRKSLCWLVESGGRQVKAFESAQSFLDAYTPDQTGCLVTDIRMPGMSGLQLQEELSERGCAIPVIIMTGYGDVATAVRAMKAGAIDFLEKPYNDQALLDLIEQAIAADREIRSQHEQGEEARSKFNSLTQREQQVMRLVVQGHSNKEMADELSISVKTIEAHRSKVMDKMEARSIAELTQLSALCL